MEMVGFCVEMLTLSFTRTGDGQRDVSFNEKM